jgi:hypothetical protein
MKIGGGVAPPPPPPPKLRVVLERAELPSWRIMSTPIVKAAPRPEVRLAAMATADQRSRATLQSMTALRDVRIVSRGLQPPALQSGQAAVTVAPPLLARLTKPSIVLNPSPPSGTNQPPVRNQPVAAPQLTATFQFLRVSIQRRWLDTTLFHLPGWLLGGISPGMFSNGSIEGNTGIFPLLPVEFVAVKQIRISGTWSEGDKQAASAALTAGSSASFGPFTLTQGDAVHGAFDGSSLTIPGIHILAWLCTPVPFLPPRQ